MHSGCSRSLIELLTAEKSRLLLVKLKDAAWGELKIPATTHGLFSPFLVMISLDLNISALAPWVKDVRAVNDFFLTNLPTCLITGILHLIPPYSLFITPLSHFCCTGIMISKHFRVHLFTIKHLVINSILIVHYSLQSTCCDIILH